MHLRTSLRVLALAVLAATPGFAQQTKANYLVQLLNELREGGLVVSKRGKTGGYRLAKDAEDISLKQVLAVVEPELVETKITLKGASGPQVAALWREVSKRFDKSLTGFTVAQLALSESGTDFEI